MNKVVMVVLGFFLLFSRAARAEHIIQKGEMVTLQRAVEIGLKNHPSVAAGQGAVEVNQAKKGQAEAEYYPRIDAATGYSRTKSSRTQNTGSLVGTSGGISGSFGQYSASVSARQTIFDFGRTGTQVKIQKHNIEASMADLAITEEQLVLNIKQAYYNFLRAGRNRVVADETVRQFQQHLEQAKAFFEVGTKPKFDVTKAEVDLSNARLALISADNAVRIARVSLNNAMGVPDAPEYALEDSLSFLKYEIKLEEAIERAYHNRPEVKAITARKTASENSIVLARKGHFPVLTGNASWTWEEDRFSTGHAWNAGVTLSIPVFSGFFIKNQVSEAKANLYVLTANEEALRQNVLFDVQQSWLDLNEAQQRIAAAELTVRQAMENYEIASGRYAAGVGNPIEVTDAEVVLSNAKTAHIQALYDYKVAIAGIEKAMGIRQGNI
jgi:outer membrane protein TolC